jgi:hypothetical protein
MRATAAGSRPPIAVRHFCSPVVKAGSHPVDVAGNVPIVTAFVGLSRAAHSGDQCTATLQTKRGGVRARLCRSRGRLCLPLWGIEGSNSKALCRKSPPVPASGGED